MAAKNLKSVEFMGKPIFYVVVEGVSYILIRPICEALGLDGEWQVKMINDDEILGSERCEHTVQIPTDDQSRKWICLPEEFIYGWLMGIKLTNTMTQETKANLVSYKRECYHILYAHFHGTLSEAKEGVMKKVRLEKERRTLHTDLMGESEKYQRLVKVDIELKLIGNPYQRYGREQYNIFKDEAFEQSMN